jgi:hypothetical protein
MIRSEARSVLLLVGFSPSLQRAARAQVTTSLDVHRTSGRNIHLSVCSEMEWTKANTLHFIELYRSKEMLWNAKHPRHFNNILRNDAWEELASELNTTEEECRKKMTGLLALLRREKGKMKKIFIMSTDCLKLHVSLQI